MSDSLSFTFDDREFGRAIQFVEDKTGRSCQESINRAALHVIIGGKGFKGAMQLTPKAGKAAIKAVSKDEVAGYLANKHRGQKFGKGVFGEMIKREIARRVRAIGYTAFVGWNNAAKAFGGSGLKGVTDSPKKEARHGYGHKAMTVKDPSAELANTAPMSENIGLIPLQKAITNVARDLVEYALRKTGDIMKKASA